MALTPEELKAIREQSVPYSAAAAKPAVEGEEPPAGLTMYPTAEEKRQAVQLGATQGATKSAGIMTGAMLGLRAGTAVAPVLGPYAPIAPVAGTLLGTAVGMLGTEQLDKLLFDDLIAAQRPEVAPYREGGKTFGESIAAAPALFAIPQMTGNRVSRFISAMGENVRKTPVTFLASEIPAAGAAGVAGGLMYNKDPEAKAGRFASEVTAGLLTPTRMLGQAVGGTYDFLKNLGYTSASGRAMLAQNTAAEQLQRILTESGEDIPKLIRLLEKDLPRSVTSPTAAQKTGSAVMTEMERALGNLNVKFAADTQAQGKDALRAYTLLAERLKNVGTPEALTQAAQLRANLFDQMLNARLATADANAAQKIVKIQKDTPQARAEIGEIVKGETSLALKNAREVETMLWDEAIRAVTKPSQRVTYRDVPMEGFKAQEIFDRTGRWPTVRIPSTQVDFPGVKPENTYRTFLSRAADTETATFDTTFPKLVQDILRDIGPTKNLKGAANSWKYAQASARISDVEPELTMLPGSYQLPEDAVVDVKKLINYRSSLLKEARKAAGNNNADEANLYSTLADAMLDDISKLKAPEFDAARDFSRALNNTFTRTFAKTATYQADVARTGAERLPAEILVSRAFGRNADVTAQRMSDIEDAVRFARTRYDDAVAKFGPKSDQARMLKPLADLADQSVVSIQDAQSRILRLAAADTIDPITGRVNPKQLQTFVSQNKTMLDKVGLTNDLTDAVKAELALKQVAAENSVLNKTLRGQTAFAKVLKGGENPTNAITDVLNGRSPAMGMDHIMQLAKAGGPDAVNGLKSTLMDYAFTKAGGIDNFDPKAFRAALFTPLGPNKPSLVTLMRQQGLMDFGEVRAINEIIRPMLRIEDALANKQSIEGIVTTGGAVTDLALRIIGSKLGASAAGHTGPGTLVAAAAGSKAMRDIFDKMPAGMTRALMEDAMRDPALMALLLKKPTSAQSANDISRSIVGRLVSSGVLPASMINYVEQQPEQTAPRQPTAAEMLQRMPPAPPTRGVPVVPAAPASAPAGGKAPSAAGKTSMGPANQKMYEALFPQDTISSLMAMQPSQG